MDRVRGERAGLRAALDIAAKDLRQRLRDRSAILVAVVAPFLLAALFSLILGGLGEGFHARWAVLDLDGGDVAEAFLDGPVRALERGGVVTLSRPADADAARAAVADGSADAAIVIPEGFSAAIRAAAGAQVELIADPDASVSAQVARSILERFTADVEAVRLAVTTALASAAGPPDAEGIAALTERAQARPSPIELAVEPIEDRTAPTATYYAAAMSILFVFFATQSGVLSLITERRERTLARMLAAPIPPLSVIGGKLLVAMILGVVSMSVIAIGMALLLGARWGDPVAIGALIVAASLAATSVSLLAVSFARTEDQAGSAVAIVTITLAILGGSFFPVAQAPDLMVQLSVLTPHAWFLRGVDAVSSGGGIREALAPIVVLAGLGLVAGIPGLLRARRALLR